MNIDDLRFDLVEEQNALENVVSDLSPGDWLLKTPSPGWTVADQIAHLTYFDNAAVTAITDPDGFKNLVSELMKRITESKVE